MGVALSAAIGLTSQAAFSDEAQNADQKADKESAVEVAAISAEQIEAETKAYIEALNRRLAEHLAERVKAMGTERIELVSAEVTPRG